MITYIKINGFKSFRNFEMEFAPLTVIAGANASGKSNLFDALHLLSRLAETDLKTAFQEQRGNPDELFTQYGENWYSRQMEFTVEMLLNRTVRDNWGGESDLKYTRLRYILTIKRLTNDRGFEDLAVAYEELENLKHDKDTWVKKFISKEYLEHWRPQVKTGKRTTPYIYTEEQNGIPTIFVSQDGKSGNKKTFLADASQTVLSSFNSVDFKHILGAKEEMRSWKFLQLNPEDLREPTRQDVGMRDTITQSGKNLAAALFRIKMKDDFLLKEISRKFNNFLHNFTDVSVEDDKAGRQFIIRLRGEEGLEFSSRVLSEGTLRLLTLCIFQYDDQHRSLLCFEEPENGIHPFRMDAMAQLIRDLAADFADREMPLRQVIVNTHSPVLVSKFIQLKKDNNVSIWLSQLITLITDIAEDGNKRIKMRITRMLPVEKEKQTLPGFSEQDRKLTISEVIRYLETADAETAIKEITR